MRSDPLTQAALHRAVTLSAEIEMQLRSVGPRAEPLVALLEKARLNATAALLQLVNVEPEEPKLIRAFQSDVKCFDRICQWLKELVADGFEADAQLTANQRDEYLDMFEVDLPEEDEQ